MPSRTGLLDIAEYLSNSRVFIGLSLTAIIGLAAILKILLPPHVPINEVVGAAAVVVVGMWLIVYYSWSWVVLAAIVFFMLGSLGGLAAGVAAAFTGALCWCRLIEGSSNPTYRQGVRFGFLAQLVAYPVLFLLSGILGVHGGAGDVPFSLFSGDTSVADIIIFLTYDMVNWLGLHGLGVLFTGPLGIAGGFLLVALRRRFPSEAESQETERGNVHH